MTARARRGAVAAVCVMLGWVAPVRAAPTLGVSAEELFEQGKQLVLQRRYAEACPLLAQSRQLDPGIGTMLWLGDCYEKNGQLASAWREFEAAAASAARRNDDRQRVALRRAASLEGRLTRLAIVAPPAGLVDGLEIRRDGVLLAPEELGSPVPVDAGAHTVTASAPGRKPWSATIELSPRPDVVSIDVPLLDPERSSEPAAPPETAPPAPRPAARADAATFEPSGSWMRISAISLGLVGLGLAGAGTFFGLQAKSTYDESNANGHCIDDACDPTGKALRSDATASATLSTLAFGAGAGAVTAGIVLFVLAPSRSARTADPGARRTAWSIVPSGSPREAGLAVTHRW